MDNLSTKKSAKSRFSEYAIKNIQAFRNKKEEPCSCRTNFQRDRDRILYSKYFRFLMHKTQVCPSPELTQIRTRLTHTLEVTQVARTIARALNLNEDLTEAIGLGHDLGHPPFGHAGEEAIKEIMSSGNGFQHNEQSLRIVQYIEDLNLTTHVQEGILRHTSPDEEYYSLHKKEKNLEKLKEDFGYPNFRPTFFEAQIVDVADEIAYLTHDLEDLLELRIISKSEIPKNWRRLFGKERRKAINGLVTNVIDHAKKILEESIHDEVDVVIIYDQDMLKKVKELKKALDKIFSKPPLGPRYSEAKRYITLLFNHWQAHPLDEINNSWAIENGESLDTAITDFIIGKTDQDIIKEYEKIFSPRTPIENLWT